MQMHPISGFFSLPIFFVQPSIACTQHMYKQTLGRSMDPISHRSILLLRAMQAFIVGLVFILCLLLLSIHWKKSSSAAKETKFISPTNRYGQRCGDQGHGSRMRPCPRNDTYCGEWVGRYWYPVGCDYQDITAAQARKCLTNRTIAFIGDSQTRDLAFGLGRFLYGESELVSESAFKFDKHGRYDGFEQLYVLKNSTRELIGNVIGAGVPCKVVEEDEEKQNIIEFCKFNFQLQVIHHTTTLEWYSENLGAIFQNKHVEQSINNIARKVDIGLINFGLHSRGYFEVDNTISLSARKSVPKYLLPFYDTVVHRLFHKMKLSFPLIWLSFNSNCPELNPKIQAQARFIDDINWFLNHQFLIEKIPYFDAAAPLRTPQRCDYSADGLHVKMFVEVMRAKMLLNHLCDEDFNWRGLSGFS